MKFIQSLFGKINSGKTPLSAQTVKTLRGIEVFLGNYGWMNSVEKWNCEDSLGLPIPWYTYPATEFLASIDLSNFQVLEYGSGNSTLWWQQRAKRVISVEGDKIWYDNVAQKLRSASNVNYMYCENRKNT